jgi:hypothetical protein
VYICHWLLTFIPYGKETTGICKDKAPSGSLRQWADRLIGERKTLKPKQPESFKQGLMFLKPQRHIDKKARMAEMIIAI